MRKYIGIHQNKIMNTEVVMEGVVDSVVEEDTVVEVVMVVAVEAAEMEGVDRIQLIERQVTLLNALNVVVQTIMLKL